MKIDILGTEYNYNITTDKEDTTLCGKAGYCDGYAKIIAIESDYNERNQDCIKDFASFKKKSLDMSAYMHFSWNQVSKTIPITSSLLNG